MKQKQKTKFPQPPLQRGIKQPSTIEKKRRWTLGLIIAALGFLLYTNTLHHGYVLDDFSVIKENNIVRQGIHAIPEIFKTSYRQGYLSVKDGLYRPLSLALFAAEWNYFPDKPGVSHFVNSMLYALTGFLLFLTLLRLFSHRLVSVEKSEALAFIASVLFIVHPLHVEVVANIKSRDEILCFLFTVSSLGFALKFTDEAKKKFLFYSSLCLFLAFLSKETAITWLVILPIALYFFRELPLKKNFVTMIPIVVVTGIYLAIRSKVLQGALADDSVSIADNVIAGAKTFSAHTGTAFYILGLYVIKLFFPHPLSYDYSFNQIPVVEMGNMFSILSLLFYTGIGIYAAFILIKSFQDKSHFSLLTSHFSFGILFFLVTVFLFSNLVLLIGTSMGDRLMYFPSLGFCICISVLYVKFFRMENLKIETGNRKLYPLLVILILFSYKTWSRNYDWKDNYTLYSHDVTLVPNSVKAHYYLGLELVKVVAETEQDAEKKKKIYEEGIAELEKAAKILPSFSSAYTQMGVAYYRMKNYEKAIENYNKANELKPADAITLNNIGTVYFEWKKYAEAKQKFQEALTVDPRFTDAYMNLGSVQGTMGDYTGAISSFQNAITYAPDNARAYFFIGITYQNMGDKANAEKYFQAAEKIDPKFKQQ
ncbi:MAG: tetratricopeptide repeat protein [Bacteroidetes bacterium]|nr:tetratricopeptide repeat protein [Bacteroidota bacterium]